jgi:hypothetical protein
MFRLSPHFMTKRVILTIEIFSSGDESFRHWQILFDGFSVASGRFRSDFPYPVVEKNQTPLDDDDVRAIVEAAETV